MEITQEDIRKILTYIEKCLLKQEEKIMPKNRGVKIRSATFIVDNNLSMQDNLQNINQILRMVKQQWYITKLSMIMYEQRPNGIRIIFTFRCWRVG